MRILRIATGGDGVGTLADGRTVFVPRTAPGDLVRLRHLKLAKSYARAEVGSIEEPSPDRVAPPCPHYERDQCGGCQLQHLAMPAQLAAKQAMVGQALRRIGRLEVEDPAIDPASEAWGYRNKVTLAVTNGGGQIGFHRQGRPGDVFDLERCLIADAALMDLWTVVREHRALLPDNAEQLILRRDRAGGCHLTVKVRGQTVWRSAALLHVALVRRGVPAVLWWEPEGGAPRAMAGASEAYPAAVFEQVHPAMGDRVRTWALDRLGDLQGTADVGPLRRHRRDHCTARCPRGAGRQRRGGRPRGARIGAAGSGGGSEAPRGESGGCRADAAGGGRGGHQPAPHRHGCPR